MTNSDWWSRAKLPPRAQLAEIRKGELLATPRKGEHAVTLEKRPVYGVGEELILSVNAHWRRMRVFLSGRTPSIDEAIAATETWLAQSGYARSRHV